MKIRKNGKTVNLTEVEVKKIINRNKINNFLSEDKESRKTEDKKVKVTSILNKLTTVSNMLRNIPTNLESLSTLNKIEEFLEKIIEDMEDKLETKKDSKTSLKEQAPDQGQEYRKIMERFLGDPENVQNRDELDEYLLRDVQHRGRKGKEVTIDFNGMEMTYKRFIDHIRRKYQQGKCYDIINYNYKNPKILGKTKITLTAREQDCKKDTAPTPAPPKKKDKPGDRPSPIKPKCEVDIKPETNDFKEIRRFQRWCLKQKRPGTNIPCYVMNNEEKKKNDADGIWECETQKCWNHCHKGGPL